MNVRHFDQWILFPILGVISACGSASPAASNKPFDVVLRATSDEGQPIAAARFTIGGSSLGTTDSNGILTTTVRGADGQTVALAANCPDGYIAPDKPTLLRLTELRRIDQTGPRTLGIDATCTRKIRDIVLVVRVGNAPPLPVDIGGRTVGQTDANGLAHFELRLDRDVPSLSVSLKTVGLSKLRPQNPSRVFELDGQDAVLLLNQTFVAEHRTSVMPRATAVKQEPSKPIPYRVD